MPIKMKRIMSTVLIAAFFMSSVAFAADAARIGISGDWAIHVQYADSEAILNVEPAEMIRVASEKYDAMPNYNPSWSWYGGIIPSKTRGAEGGPVDGILDVASVVVRDGTGADAVTFELGKDYQMVPGWYNIGRIPEGRIQENQPVWVSYRYGWMRLDSVVLTPKGEIAIRKGPPHVVMPTPPKLTSNEIRLGNLWIRPNREKLDGNMVFPILENAFPEKKTTAGPSVVEKLLPKTWAKIKSGEPIKILAWGDSVTDGSYLPDKNQRWQEQFVKALRTRFPEAKFELVTEAWGGRTTETYLAEPPGSEHNYQEKVLNVKPDFIVSEFVNDAGIHPDAFQGRHERILNDFRQIGAEWIILTPHYIKPSWMGLDRERNIDDDPRQYTKDVRRFGAENNIAVADAALRYGRLWRQGIPYSTLMGNNINHPNEAGMKIFVDALMELFPEK